MRLIHSTRTRNSTTSYDTTCRCLISTKRGKPRRVHFEMVGRFLHSFCPELTLRAYAELSSLTAMQGNTCQYLKSVVERYLDQSGRRWVQMSALFSFVKL